MRDQVGQIVLIIGNNPLVGGHIEVTVLSKILHGSGGKVITETDIQGQLLGDLPVILEKDWEVHFRLTEEVAREIPGCSGRESEKEVYKAIPAVSVRVERKISA